MKLRVDQLGAHLQKQLLPIYLVSGDETLLVQECCDQIRQHCRAQGFTEREVFDADTGIDWNQLAGSCNELSLFSDKKIVELRLGNGKVDKDGSAMLCDFVERADGNTVMLVSCTRLDRNQQRSKWIGAIEKGGAFIQVWPIERTQLPRWIDQRLKAAGLRTEPQAVELLADRVEGNLLAAAQEVEKLKVLAGDSVLTADLVAATVADSARYDVFKLIDNALNGRADVALRMLHSLRAEGAEGIPLLGALSRELRGLYQCAVQVERGNGIERVLDSARVWDKRKALYKAVLRRLSSHQLGALLRRAQRIDLAQKGQSKDDAWQLLDQLVAALAGTTVLAG